MNGVGPIEEVEAGRMRLRLKSTFRTHWKTIREHETLLLRLRSGGVWGEGEAYTMDPEGGLACLERLPLAGRDPREIDAILAEVSHAAARSAVDLALHDLIGKLAGWPVWRLLGLASCERTSCVSVGIDTPEAMLAAATARIEQGYPILKVKLTRSVDPAVVREIRAIGGPSLRIWVDANQAFDPDGAVATARALEPAGIEIFEQPMPVGALSACASVRRRIGIPIYLDEEITSAADVARATIAGGVDGINVKLAKMGGLREALRAIHVARAHGMNVLLGCFFESSLGIAGETQILSLVDHADLDAPLFMENDPYTGLVFRGARIAPPAGAGLGVRRP